MEWCRGGLSTPREGVLQLPQHAVCSFQFRGHLGHERPRVHQTPAQAARACPNSQKLASNLAAPPVTAAVRCAPAGARAPPSRPSPTLRPRLRAPARVCTTLLHPFRAPNVEIDLGTCKLHTVAATLMQAAQRCEGQRTRQHVGCCCYCAQPRSAAASPLARGGCCAAADCGRRRCLRCRRRSRRRAAAPSCRRH
jgi:hypothetical protein